MIQLLIQNYIEYSNRKFHLAKSTERDSARPSPGDRNLPKLDRGEDDEDLMDHHYHHGRVNQVGQVSYHQKWGGKSPLGRG